ncbi:MAG TPA: hypothetical protein VL947_02180 [Cytophagales bacterium]|nr:hypothetical protein [Cytophagales bacterium]
MFKILKFPIGLVLLGILLSSCVASTYLNQKVTAPVFTDSTKVVSYMYVGSRKQEINISYAPIKRVFVTSDLYVGNIEPFKFRGGQLAYDLGIGYVPLQRSKFQVTGIVSGGRGKIDSKFQYSPIFNDHTYHKNIKTDYNKLNMTAYMTLHLDEVVDLSFGLRNSFIKYNDFYMDRLEQRSPIKSTEPEHDYSDTIRFRNKSFVTLDPFLYFDIKPTKHLGCNIQFMRSFSTKFHIDFDSYRRNRDRSGAPDRLTIVRDRIVLPFYKANIINVGAYLVF